MLINRGRERARQRSPWRLDPITRSSVREN
jgi:hypothetical protein